MSTKTDDDRDKAYLAVQRERKRASVRPLDLSFNELADMHSTGEIQIRPEYQRIYRWSDETSSRFIESLILEMPVPPIYVLQVEEGKWELIDGLQRLSSYLYLRGELDLDPNGYEREQPIRRGQDKLILKGCDIVPELNGFDFDNLPASIQYRIRRATLRVEVIRREGNANFAYHMFTRLNTGGELLSDQEVRNCGIRLLGNEFIDFINRISNDEDFAICTEKLTQKQLSRMMRQELVLRFFAFKNNLDDYTHNISPFLTEYMERVTTPNDPRGLRFHYDSEFIIFKRTFHLIRQSGGSNTFCRWIGNNPAGGFSMNHYEAFSIGCARVLNDNWNLTDDVLLEPLRKGIETAKVDPSMKALTVGGGKNFKRIYEEKIKLVEDSIRSHL